MTKQNQIIAIIILIPMLFFTFVITVKPKDKSISSDPKKIIYEYFDLKNKKDLKSISRLITDTSKLKDLKLELNSIKKISLLDVIEEKNESIINAYLKYNEEANVTNIKIYKVKYDITYNQVNDNFKNSGVYDSWCFLFKKDKSSDWLIDICEI